MDIKNAYDKQNNLKLLDECGSSGIIYDLYVFIQVSLIIAVLMLPLTIIVLFALHKVGYLNEFLGAYLIGLVVFIYRYNEISIREECIEDYSFQTIKMAFYFAIITTSIYAIYKNNK